MTSFRFAIWLIPAVALGVVACGGGGDSRPSFDVDAAYELRLDAFDGSAFSLDELGPRPIVVNFWATDCAPCVHEMPAFQQVHADLGEAVAFVGIDVDDRPDEADEFATRTGVTYTLVRDPDFAIATAFQASALPTTIVFAADRSIVAVHLGALTADDLRERIDEALDT